MTSLYQFAEENLGDIPDSDLDEPADWIWRWRIPQEKVTLISGDSGVGKSRSISSILTSVIHGDPFPDGLGPEVPPGTVLLVTTESAGRELATTLKVQGCTQEDRDYFIRLPYVVRKTGNEEPVPFDIDYHWDAMVEKVEKYRPRMILFDPLVEFHSRKEIDSKAVRGLLGKLGSFCAQYHTAILGLIHWNKDEKLTHKHRISGSHQYAAAVKSIITVYQDDKNLKLRHFVQEKHNLGPEPGPLSFTIDPPDGLVIWTPYGEEDSKVIEAKLWLLENLKEDKSLSCRQCCEITGISERTMRTARASIGNLIVDAPRYRNGITQTYWELWGPLNNYGVPRISMGS